MKLTYHSTKDESNFKKHGVSLAKAEFLDWDDALSWADNRNDYSEERRIALVTLKQRLYCVVYIDLKTVRRIISLRKANSREINKYEKETN
ncbi:BrnT family toxin [Polynucleobacter antarcticus]|uniref:Uncharacterized protein n=1 Tax=Polynucleobacter antarcticus TaxID=1743162 RepID=A0A6M9PR43_9BURK|nr:BrnT family toxin [Polynucleobacter antarcticus]QKM62811.1 hypothetical protein DCO16_06930 [Polynucleobacter antarcticus]